VLRDQDATATPAKPIPTSGSLSERASACYRIASRLFGRKPVKEAVATRVHFDANPGTVWNHLLFYEEVPGRPPFLLRALLPHPVRTEGVKTRVGATVRCTYSGGHLVKCITRVESPHLLQFEVVEQHLRIESCVLTLGGSYKICSRGNTTEVIVITNYLAYLRPRYLWRRLEALLIHQLHRHILRGMSAVALPGSPVKHPLVAEPFPSHYVPPGDSPCTTSPSPSRR
jgi:hypothetical protein